MTPEMEAAAFDGLANNPTAQRYAEGRADNETRSRLLEARDRALANDGHRDAGLLAFAIHRRCPCGGETTITLPDPTATERNAAAFDRAHAGCPSRADGATLAFIVRDLMDAAAYPYTPDRPLTEQARECCQLIRQTADQLGRLEDTYARFGESHDAQVQRLTDLVNELHKQLAGADRRAAQLENRARKAESLTRELSADLTAERQRTADLDQLLQARDAFIEAICPCLPDAPAHKHLTGGYAFTKDIP